MSPGHGISESMEGYDVIGDIHGHADRLTSLLKKLGYVSDGGVHRHPNRKALFLGDFIDRGPAIRETLSIVRAMVDNGTALAVMGNHEYNAVAYATPAPEGGFLRSHRPERVDQHRETLLAFEGAEGEWRDHLRWFTTLPLFLDLGGVRAVHACWHDDHNTHLQKLFDGRLTEGLLYDSCIRTKPEHLVVEEVLKGRELPLPEGVTFKDKGGHVRRKARTRWWLPSQGMRPSEYLFGIEAEHDPLIDVPECDGYPIDAPPVFIGHYWLTAETPRLQTHNVACLDFSVAAGGFLCAYRWSGERRLSPERFVTA